MRRATPKATAGTMIVCLSVLVVLLMTSPSIFAQDFRISVDTTTTYQRMEGWGGHVYPQTWRFHASDPDYEAKLFDDLDVTHIRLRSVWYLLEASNDNDDPGVIDFDAIAKSDTGLVHDELLLQQRIAEKGVTLQFASWRFPYWMAGQNSDWQPQPSDKPPLDASMEAEYVESIAAYMLYARNRYGFVFDAVSIANEPDLGIYIVGLDPARLIRLSSMLKDRLTREGYVVDASGQTSVQFYLPDVAAADSVSLAYAEAYLVESARSDVADAFSYHSYRREPAIMERFAQLAAQQGIPVWAMEQSHTHLAAVDRFEWSHALDNAVCLYDVLVSSNATLSLYWSLAMATSGGLGLYVPEKKAWAPAYDMLKHFYNFVPVASRRVQTDLSRVESGSSTSPWADEAGVALLAVSFVRPDGGVVAILINSGGTDLDVVVDGTVGGSARAVASDPIWRAYELPVTASGSAWHSTVPARGVVTMEFGHD